MIPLAKCDKCLTFFDPCHGDHHCLGKIAVTLQDPVGMDSPLVDPRFVALPAPKVRACLQVFTTNLKWDGERAGFAKEEIPCESDIYWACSFEEETFMPDDLVWRILKAVDVRQLKLDAKHLDIEMQLCVTTTGPMPSLCFPPDLIKELAAIGAGLDIDVILTAEAKK